MKFSIVRLIFMVVIMGGVIDVIYFFDIFYLFEWKGVYIDVDF